MQEDYKVPKLNNENYHQWSIRTKAALIHKELWESIDPGYGTTMTAQQKKVNDKSLAFLFLVVDDSFLDDISQSVRSKDAWEILEGIHTNYGLLHALQLMRELFNMCKKKEEKIHDYIGRIMDLHRKLSSCGYSFTDRELALIMLMGLPPEYESLILALERDEKQIDTVKVKARLFIEEKRITRRAEEKDIEQEELSSKALLTLSRNNTRFKKPWTNNEGKERKFHKPEKKEERSYRCFCCGEMGHIASNCPEISKQKKNEKWGRNHKALMASSKREKSNKGTWLLDSGATDHMSPFPDKFGNLKKKVSTIITAAEDCKLTVEGSGSIEMKLSKQHGGWDITLTEVLYVPGLEENLLSVSKIEEKGLTVIFEEGMARVLDIDGSEVLRAIKEGGIFYIKEKETKALTAKKEDEETWHKRMGHLNYADLTKLKGTTNTPIKSNVHHPCKTCIRGKMKKKPYISTGISKATKVLEVIHTDVCGPIEPRSKGDAKYFATFIDEFTRFVKVYTLKTKDEVFEKFKEYKEEVENLQSSKIKTVRSDNGGEYVNKRFDDALKGWGIRRQRTVPYNPQQNGIAERMNETLLNTTRCLLIDSGIPKMFWGDAITTAASIRNKCPSKSIDGEIPEEKWTGKDVALQHLRVYGCKAWYKVRKDQKGSKLDAQARKCVLIGYQEGTKGYKLWDYNNDKILMSRDVLFEEDKFPFALKEVSTENHKYEQMGNDPETLNDETIYLSQDNLDIGVQPEVIVQHNTNQSNKTETPEPTFENTERPSKETTTLFEDYGDERYDVDRTTLPLTPQICENRRSERQARQREHKIRNDELASCKTAKNESTANTEPLTIEAAFAAHDSEKWYDAVIEELHNLERNETWTLIPKPDGRKIVGSKWLFRKKYDQDGKLDRYKCRLVAKGFTQTRGIDYDDTYSPVVKMKSLRILLALAAKWKWKIRQVDVTAAYLNGTLSEEVLMAQPEGFEVKGKETWVCKLHKSIYGLKQSGREWNACLDNILKSIGLKRSRAEPCIYFNLEMGIILGVYVDDLEIVTKSKREADWLITKLKESLSIKDLGSNNKLLSINIRQNEDETISLNQTMYIEEILKTFGMMDSKGVTSPMDLGIKLEKVTDEKWEENKDRTNAIPYRQAIGSLIYLAGATRPDIAHATAYLSQFNEKFSNDHWKAVKHVFRYLKQTKDYNIVYKSNNEGLTAYSDADWARDIIDRRSFTGYLFLLGGTIISWSSKKQQTTALSTSEAEFLAMGSTSKEAMWLKNLFNEIGLSEELEDTIKIKADNQGAICLAKNQITSERSKHIDLRYFYLRELIDRKQIEFEYVPSESNLADMFTKPLGGNQTREHSEKFGLLNKEGC